MENNNNNIQVCSLVGNSFANAMQFVVATVATCVLLLHKIFIEDDLFRWKSKLLVCILRRPLPKYRLQRLWGLWLMDNAKQGLSNTLAHIYATYIAVLFSNYSQDEGDPCAWFLTQFIIDTCLGVFLSFGLSKLSIFIIGECNQPLAKRWFSIGNYNTMSPNTRYAIWGVQVFHWIVCSILARLFCSLFMLLSYPLWLGFTGWFSNLWMGHRHAELVFVVLGMPILMNSFQFLLTNWYLEWKRPVTNNEHLLDINRDEIQ